MDPKIRPLQAQPDRQQSVGLESYLTSSESVLMTLQTSISILLTTTLQDGHYHRGTIPDRKREAERLSRLSGPEDGYADAWVYTHMHAHTISSCVYPHVYEGIHLNGQGDGLKCPSGLSESRSQEAARAGTGTSIEISDKSHGKVLTCVSRVIGGLG